MAQTVKNLPANAGELGSVSGLGRFAGEGNDYPLQPKYERRRVCIRKTLNKRFDSQKIDSM